MGGFDVDVDVEGRPEPRGDRKLRGQESREAGETQSRRSRARVKVIYGDGMQSRKFVRSKKGGGRKKRGSNETMKRIQCRRQEQEAMNCQLGREEFQRWLQGHRLRWKEKGVGFGLRQIQGGGFWSWAALRCGAVR